MISPPSPPSKSPATSPPDGSAVTTSITDDTASDYLIKKLGLDPKGKKVKDPKVILINAQKLCLMAEKGYVNVDLENIDLVVHGYHNERPIDNNAIESLNREMDMGGDQRILNPIFIVVDLQGLINPPSATSNPELRPTLEVKPNTVVWGLAGQHRLHVGNMRYLKAKTKLESLIEENAPEEEIEILQEELKELRYWPARVYDPSL